MKEITLKVTDEEYAAVCALASAARQSPEAWALSAIRKAQQKAKEDAAAQAEDVCEAYSYLVDDMPRFSGKFENCCFNIEQFLSEYTKNSIAVLRKKRTLKLALKRLIENGHVTAYVECWGETKYHTHKF
ncbi:TPA: hypothetical protein ACITN2_004683 [Salmonella enterica subsp. enterica serovar Virchow]